MPSCITTDMYERERGRLTCLWHAEKHCWRMRRATSLVATTLAASGFACSLRPVWLMARSGLTVVQLRREMRVARPCPDLPRDEASYTPSLEPAGAG